MTSAGSGNDGSASNIASVLHIAYDQTHVVPSVHPATGGRELYTMIAVYNSDRLGVSADP